MILELDVPNPVISDQGGKLINYSPHLDHGGNTLEGNIHSGFEIFSLC